MENKNINIMQSGKLITNILLAYKNNPKLGKKIILSTTTEVNNETFEITNNIIGNTFTEIDLNMAKNIQKWHSELRYINTQNTTANLYTKLSLADVIMHTKKPA